MADFFRGFGHAFLGLIGFGQYVDPMGDLNSELSTANQNLAKIVNTGTQASLIAQEGFDTTLQQYLKNKFGEIQESMNYYNIISSNNQAQDNYFLLCGAILIFMIIIFILFK
jgi:hypothetical protein